MMLASLPGLKDQPDARAWALCSRGALCVSWPVHTRGLARSHPGGQSPEERWTSKTPRIKATGKAATRAEAITYTCIVLHIRQKPLANLKQLRWLNLKFYFLYRKSLSVLRRTSLCQVLQQPLRYFEKRTQGIPHHFWMTLSSRPVSRDLLLHSSQRVISPLSTTTNFHATTVSAGRGTERNQNPSLLRWSAM